MIIRYIENIRNPGMIYTKIILVMIVCTLLATTSGNASAQDSATDRIKNVEIEYGYPDQSIFIATTDGKGQPATPMIRLAKVLMEKLGIPWHAMAYPARRLFDNLQNGTTHFSILVRASSLQKCCILSRQPVYSTRLNVYYTGNKPPVKTKEELAGKKIITIRGYSYGGLLKYISDPVNKITTEVAGTHKAAFKMLESNRADYLVDYESAASDILAENPVTNLHSNPISTLDIFLVLSRSYPGAEKLMTELEEIVQTFNVEKILKGNAATK